MSPLNARALSMALVAGVAGLVYFSQGFYFWAGLAGWAALLEAGGDTPALKKAIAGTSFGALLAWTAVVVSMLIPIPDGGFWVPRLAAVVAVSMYILVIASRVPLLSSIIGSLLGYATVLAGTTVTLEYVAGMERLTGLHHSNPLVAALVGMIGGALCGVIANALAGTLARK